jgi:hypothetical protein
MKLHSETVATYYINVTPYHVIMCWQGKDPAEDTDLFYDIYAGSGVHRICLNLGEPWHDDGSGIPTYEDIAAYITDHPSLLDPPVEYAARYNKG